MLVGLIDCAWLTYAGFRIDFGIARSVGVISLLLIIGIFYKRRDERLMEFGLFGAQYLSLFTVMIPISYLAASTNASLVDGTFDAFDKAMGLDWVAWAEWVLAHPTLRWLLRIAYQSLTIQALFCYMYNIHARANSKNNEIWWTTFVAALATIGIGALVPAVSAWVYYGLASMHDFPHMQQFAALRASTMRVVSFSDAQGFVQFPSFHTIFAIILTYNLRHNRCLFSLAAALNAALIFACPTEGGHYFIDLAGGAGVAAATICGVRAVQRRFDARLSRLRLTRPRSATMPLITSVQRSRQPPEADRVGRSKSAARPGPAGTP